MNYSIAGLETLTMTSLPVGLLKLEGKIQLPVATDSGTAASQVVATIKQNGSTILTTTAGSDGFSIPVLLAAGDSITVALTSSLAGDEVLNAVCAVISLG
jgi:hypothetical protein